MKTESIVLSAVLLTGWAHFVPAADNLSAALQKGLLEEEANHNLDAAIQAYQSVVDQFGDQRKITATAVFRLGECYRKQGKTNEAVLQYQRVLADFADQASLIGPSEKSLATLGQSSRPAEARQVSPTTRTVTDPDQLKLLREEIKLMESGVAASEAAVNVGKGELSDVAKSKKELLELQRQLPENASAASQKGLLDQEIQLVEQLLAEKKKQVEAGAAPILATAPLQRELLGLKRELIAVTETPSKAIDIISYKQAAAASKVDEETKTIERYKALAQNSPDLLNAKNPQDGSTPLHHSAGKGQMAVAKFLLANGGDVASRDNQGSTPLHNAALQDQKPMVELLLAHHAEVNAKSWGGVTPLHWAASRGFLSLAETLLANGADPNAETSARTIEPLAADSTGFGNPQANELYFGATPLHYAAAGGYLAVVRLLLDHKADVNAKSKGGQTPLFAAVEKNRVEVAKLLLANRANPNIKTSYGMTLFGAAIGNRELMKSLLAAGADINAKGIASGYTPFFQGGLSTINFASPLAYAAYTGQTELADWLLKNKADANSKDDAGNTPLNGATAHGHLKMVKLLLEQGADPDHKNQEGQTPLHVSTSKEISELLLASKANVNAKNETGSTPLHNALGAPDSNELVELLLSKGADANAVDNYGQSPLFRAVLALDKENIALLIAHGADVNAKDSQGKTPLDLLVKPSASSIATIPTRQIRVPTGNVPGVLPAPGVRVRPDGAPRTATSDEITALLRKHGAKE